MPKRVSGFLDQYPKPSTRNGYQSGIIAFFSFIYNFKRKGKRISDNEKKQMEILADKYFREDRNYEQDLISFSNYCSKNFAPCTASYYITGVREFYLFNDVELTRKQERNLMNKISRGEPISREEELNKEIIRQLLSVSDLKLKTLILVLISSGMRLGEALSLTSDDIKIYPDYGVIHLKGTKTKNKHSRITFINKEAVELLNLWLSQRDKYIKYITGRSRGRFEVKAAKNKIFPFGKNNAENCFRRLLKNSGLLKKDEDTDRSTIHYHMFRKYFVTNISYSGIDSKYVDFFVGHTNKLDKAYNIPTIEKLYEFYSKGEPYLRIYDDSVEEISSLKSTVDKNKETLTDLKIDNISMQLKLQNVEKKLLEMKTMVMKFTLNSPIVDGIGALDNFYPSIVPPELLKKIEKKFSDGV